MTAIVVLLLLSGIAVYTLKVSSVQQSTSAADVLGIRAYHAARAGLEWGAYQVLQGSLAGGFCNGGATAQTLSNLAADLAVFTVVVSCARSDHAEAGSTVRIYTIAATACNQAACPGATPIANYVERQSTIVVSR